MKTLPLIALVGILGLCGHVNAQSTFDIYLYETGGNVEADGSGTFDITDLNDAGNVNSVASMQPSGGSISLSSTASFSGESYDAITGPSDFGSGGNTFASTSSGDVVVLIPGLNRVGLPSGYVSGSSLSDTATWDAATLSSLGATPGTYTWTWGSGAHAGALNLFVGTAPPSVPEPSQYGLGIFLAAAGFIAWRRFSIRATSR